MTVQRSRSACAVHTGFEQKWSADHVQRYIKLEDIEVLTVHSDVREILQYEQSLGVF